MAFENWEKDEDGLAKVYPLTGWDMFLPYGMACGIRVRYVSDEAMLLRGEFQGLPLVLTPAQAREIAADLLKIAERAEARPSPDTPMN